MNKLRKLLALMLVLSMLFTLSVSVLTGCDGADNVETTDESTEGTDETTGGSGETTGGAETDPPLSGKHDFSITVTSKGGLPLGDVTLLIYADATLEDLVAYTATDASGVAKVNLEAGTTYTAFVAEAPEGYQTGESYPIVGLETSIALTSSVITDNTSLSGKKYALGDVMRDFTVTDTDGNVIQLSKLLEEKKMVLLNFFFTTCNPCVAEFPYMNSVYEQYKDDVAVVALNHYASDSEEKIRLFKSQHGLTFPMAKEDLGMQTAFNLSGYPTSVVIDRYGVICLIEAGGLPSEEPFQKIFKHFTADNYTQQLFGSLEELIPPEKPTAQMPSSDEMSAALGTTGLGVVYAPETEGESAEYSWPFVITEKNGKTCIAPSNKNVTGSYAILYATVKLKAGDVLAFDYFASCEEGMDILYVLVDGKDIFQISGNRVNDWATCYPYVALEDGEYELAFCYLKDESENVGDDVVYVKDLRVEAVKDIDVATWIPRHAANKLREDGFGYESYASVVYNETDGYYHVGSKDGPLLLANMMTASRFSDTSVWLSVYYGVQDGTFTEELALGVERYAMYANNSQVYGLCPVTTELRGYLEIVAETLGLEQSENEWLQTCVYYDAYGPGVQHLQDPTKGLWYHSAFDAVMGKENVVTYDRILVPRGLWYKFVPTVSGAYRIETNTVSDNIRDSLVGWVFLQDGTVYYEYKNEERLYNDPVNVSMVVYLEAGTPYYIDIAYWDVNRAVGNFTFDIEYIAPELQHFVMAAPGPATYYESEDGILDTNRIVIGGIKAALGTDGYYYELREDGTLGSLIYADFLGYTEIFERTSIQTMVEKTKSFNFKITVDDQWVLDFLAIFEKDGISYREGFKIEWGDDYDYYMEYYQVEDVAAGRYHGEGEDYTEAMQKYVKKMIAASTKNPELEGCVPVDAELAEILQKLVDKFWFEGDDTWLELCYYYDSLGPASAP